VSSGYETASLHSDPKGGGIMKRSVERYWLSALIGVVLLLCFSVACQDKAAMAELEKYKVQATLEEQNVALVHQLFKAIDTQDYNRLKELLAPGAILHGTAPQEDVTADNSAQLLGPLFQALPDLSHSVEDIFAKGDRVAARVLIQATHKGILMGIPPSGNKLGYYQFAIFQIGDGKIQEAWRVTDSLGMMQQLGMELRPKEPKK
jgi:steroid delta-isomerase-like uncharacterized protein